LTFCGLQNTKLTVTVEVVEVLILCFYCNCVCISLRDLSSSILLGIYYTWSKTYLR